MRSRGSCAQIRLFYGFPVPGCAFSPCPPDFGNCPNLHSQSQICLDMTIKTYCDWAVDECMIASLSDTYKWSHSNSITAPLQTFHRPYWTRYTRGTIYNRLGFTLLLFRSCVGLSFVVTFVTLLLLWDFHGTRIPYILRSRSRACYLVPALYGVNVRDSP